MKKRLMRLEKKEHGRRILREKSSGDKALRIVKDHSVR